MHWSFGIILTEFAGKPKIWIFKGSHTKKSFFSGPAMISLLTEYNGSKLRSTHWMGFLFETLQTSFCQSNAFLKSAKANMSQWLESGMKKYWWLVLYARWQGPGLALTHRKIYWMILQETILFPGERARALWILIYEVQMYYFSTILLLYHDTEHMIFGWLIFFHTRN